MNIYSIREACVKTHGIDPGFLYCASTGFTIGIIEESELALTLLTMQADDEESIVDDLATRTLIAARPSTAWNSMTIHTLDAMRVHAPKQLLAYLLNRMYAPNDVTNSSLKLTLDQRINNIRSRIQLAAIIDSITFVPHKLNNLLLGLLSLDAKFNLSKLVTPKSMPFLAACIEPEAFDQLIQKVWNWFGRLAAEEEKAIKAANLSRSFWSQGNWLAKKAYSAQLEMMTPPSKAKVAKAEKTAKYADGLSFLDSLESELVDDLIAAEPLAIVATVSAAATVTLKPLTPGTRVMRFGGLAKKES